MSFKDFIRRTEPYVPGEQPKDPDMIKLNTNENPYPPSPAVEKALDGLPAASLRLYPDPAVSDLIMAIADVKGISKEEVFAGVGSDDVLAMCFLTFFNSEKPILFPDITYSFYDVWAELFRIPFKRMALRDDFTIDPADYAGDNGGIIFPNPNAPTGLLLPLKEVEKIVSGNPGSVVIVDEAYIDFGGESALPLIRKYKNLIVVQTFSKSRNLAGMRIGFAMADPELISALNDVKYSFNSYTMSRPAIAAGTASMRDTDYFEKCTKRIVKTRTWAAEELRALGFSVPESASNFLFITHESVPARELFEYLKTQHIYVRYFDKPRISNYLRVTVGTDAEMETLIRVLRSYMEN